MALSGSKTVLVQELLGRKTYLEFSWNIKSQSMEGNYSIIEWKLDFVGENGGFYSSIYQEPYSVTVNGKEYTGEKNLKLGINERITIASAEQQIIHNSSGTKTFSYSFSVEFDGWNLAESNPSRSGNGNGVLDSIARAAEIRSIPDFNDEEYPVINYYLYAENVFTFKSVEGCISFTGETDDIPYRSLSVNPGHHSWTFVLTKEEREILRSHFLPQSPIVEVMFKIKSIPSATPSEEYETSHIGILTFVDYLPTIQPPVKAAEGDRTRELTGDSEGNTLIRFYSDAEFSTNAEPGKANYIENQYVKCGDQIVAGNMPEGSVEDVWSGNFTFNATDDYGYTVEDSVTLNIVPYIKPTCSIKSAEIDTNGNLTFTIVGKYFNGSFGAKDNIFKVFYNLEENNQPMYDEEQILEVENLDNIVDEEGNYTYTHTLSGLTHTNQYIFKVRMSDEIISIENAKIKILGNIPLFDWGKSDFKHYTNVNFIPDKSINGIGSDGSEIIALEPYDSDGNTKLGYGNYEKGSGSTSVYGNQVNIYTKNGLFLNGNKYGENTVLWQGVSHMNEVQYVNLSEPISEQPTGIVLVFSLYNNDTAQVSNTSFNTFFISKKEVELLPNMPHTFLMGINAGFSKIGAKYIYIDDQTLTGHEGNTSSGTNSGITFNNSWYVLRYVIGV